MKRKTASKFRKNICRLLDESTDTHKSVLITGSRYNAVLIGEEDCNSIQKTLHLISVPRMRESIREGLADSAGGH